MRVTIPSQAGKGFSFPEGVETSECVPTIISRIAPDLPLDKLLYFQSNASKENDIVHAVMKITGYM